MLKSNNEIVEIQIDDDGCIENSFKLSSDMGFFLKMRMLNLSMENENLFRNVELISRHEKDNLTFLEKTTCIIYNTFPHKTLVEEYNLTCKLRDYYGVKINENTNKKTYKFYREFEKTNRVPELPKGCILAKEFGIGFYRESKVSDFIDIYFYHTSAKEVYSHFNKSEPMESRKYISNNLCLFGLTFSKTDLTVKKLKRYIYPNDIHIENRELIYGKTNIIY